MEKLEDILKLLLKWYVKFTCVSILIALVISFIVFLGYLLFNHLNF